MSRTLHGKTVDPDNDHGYRKPRGWRDAKNALGPGGQVVDQMTRLEQLPGCPRYFLAVAVHAFLDLSDDERQDAVQHFSGDETDKRDVARGGKVINPWKRTAQLLRRTKAHYLHRIVGDFEGVAAELGYDPCLLLAMALNAATDWDEGEAERAMAVMFAHYRAGEAAPGAAPAAEDEDADDGVGTADAPPPSAPASHWRLRNPRPGESMAAAWARLAPKEWPLPPNVPADATLHADPDSGHPPVILDGSMNYVCPHCGSVQGTCEGHRRHLMAQHRWTVGPRDEVQPPMLLMPWREELPPAQRKRWADGFDAAVRKVMGEDGPERRAA